MTVNLLDTVFDNQFSGLGNNQAIDFSVAIPSQAIAANGAVIYVAQTPITRTTSISEVQLRYTGRDTLWYWLDGFQSFTDPSGNFIISTRAYIQTGILYVSNFILEVTGLGITLPAFTVDCRGFLYDAPF